MIKLPDSREGTFVRIPLTDGSFGYGRILSAPYIAFYNYRTPGPSSDCDAIASQPILFIQGVGLLDQERWTSIGWKPLAGEVARPVVRFMQDVMNWRKCTLFDSAGMKREVEPEDCVGIERAAVWDPHHIEERLLDTFLGRPNQTEVRARVRLK